MVVDHMQAYDLFLERISDNQREIVECLDNLFLTFPEIGRKIRFKIPFYDYKSWVCYLNPKKKDAIELCFIYGKQLSNIQGLLEDHGRKQVSGITIYKVQDLNLDFIAEIFSEALILNDEMKSLK
ncbi:MAG: DUF1801 domain-containing protein [Saprospiraceae bacterium]|nr:DUF1801 domain-containing protein [Saprospiraceae bacterium]